MRDRVRSSGEAGVDVLTEYERQPGKAAARISNRTPLRLPDAVRARRDGSKDAPVTKARTPEIREARRGRT